MLNKRFDNLKMAHA